MDAGLEQERGKRTVFLHIGCPKSGTSHIQARLRASPETAREQGLFWPLPWGRQVRRRDLRARTVSARTRGPVPGRSSASEILAASGESGPHLHGVAGVALNPGPDRDLRPNARAGATGSHLYGA